MDDVVKNSDTATRNSKDVDDLIFYRFVIDNVPCAVVTVDSEFKISSMNPWAEKLTGYSSKEAIGRYCGDILRGGMCSVHCPLKEAMQGVQAAVRIDTTIQNKHGETIPVSMNTAALLNEKRDLVGGVEAFQDISHLKALEREKANLISMIAHDIKTPVVTIGGFARRLLKKDLDTDKEKQKQYVEIISGEATRAELLVNDFLEFSRLEVGALNLDFGPTSLDKELIELLKTYEPKALKRGIRIEIASPKSLSIIDADAKRLRRVFTNLLDNALKFSQDKGTVTIAIQERENDITVKVTDQGVGIKAKDIRYIFEPFHQIQDRGEKQGFGLGLAIVKAIVKGHGGRILVESEPGKGSAFSVVLPKPKKLDFTPA
ncbi:MAG: PAS domain-containing sensor histidine kinase [Deltaproteobacteria bacterium]|nr:PAS domain-containing sensor histidine kinase [Deltaproteobacteria bacterium]